MLRKLAFDTCQRDQKKFSTKPIMTYIFFFSEGSNWTSLGALLFSELLWLLFPFALLLSSNFLSAFFGEFKMQSPLHWNYISIADKYVLIC